MQVQMVMETKASPSPVSDSACWGKAWGRAYMISGPVADAGDPWPPWRN